VNQTARNLLRWASIQLVIGIGLYLISIGVDAVTENVYPNNIVVGISGYLGGFLIFGSIVVGALGLLLAAGIFEEYLKPVKE
jgi:TRAP-type C4-dicarboxylate transport system permease small subunit